MNETRESVERSYNRWMRFIAIWRVSCIIYALAVSWAALSSPERGYLWLYLAFPVIWWWLSTMWASDQRRLRDRQLDTIAFIEAAQALRSKLSSDDER